MNSAVLAQLVEHITRNDEVVGSIPTNGSKKSSTYNLDCRCFFIRAVVNAVIKSEMAHEKH